MVRIYEYIPREEEFAYTDKTGAEIRPLLASEVYALAAVAYDEMQRLSPDGEPAWEHLSSWDQDFYALVIERVLVERELILRFFAHRNDVGRPLKAGE